MGEDFVDPIDRTSREWEFTVAFHSVKCHLNHTDMCGFGYPRQVVCNRRWMESAATFRADAGYGIIELTRILNILSKATS